MSPQAAPGLGEDKERESNILIEATPESPAKAAEDSSRDQLSPLAWFRMLAKELHWSFVFGVVATYGISQGLGGGINRVASDYYWKDVQQVQPSVAQVYQGITSIPWMIKPLWGLLTDVLPVAGYRRRPYFILAGFIGVIAMLIISLHSKLHALFALLALITGSASVAIADVTIDACVAENSINYPHLAADMMTLTGFCASVGGLIGFSISGLLVHAIGSKGALGLLIIPSALVILAGLLLKEVRIPNFPYEQAHKKFVEASEKMLTTLKCPEVWRPCVYMFMSLALNVDIQEGMFYWYTDKSAGPSFSEDMYHNVLDEPSPLGLRLKKSPSLLDLIQMRLSQASNAGQSSMENGKSEPSKKKDIKSGAPAAVERLKASNFPASVLRIGTWEYISRYEGDLVAKCYFAKHKLVWEVLEGGLKSKIEIQWSDFTALKVNCPENGQGTLDVVLGRPPLFFKETDPQPRKHTLWQATSDFTGGQASMHRRHFLQCPSTLLSKNFEKLIQCDQRLNQLSLQPDIVLDSPVFEPRCSIFEDPVESKCTSFTNLKDEHEALSGYSGSVSPCAGSSMSAKNEANDSIGIQAEFLPPTLTPGVGAVGVQAVNRSVSGAVPELNIPHWWSQLKVRGLKPSMSVDDLVNHLGNCISEQITSGNAALPDNEVPTKETLEGIAQYLLGDTQGPPVSASDELSLMARVDSLCCLIQKDAAPVVQPKPEPNDSDSIGVEASDGSDEEFTSAPRKITDASDPPVMSRKDSFGELLTNLPRIASLPQFYFKIPEDYEN